MCLDFGHGRRWWAAGVPAFKGLMIRPATLEDLPALLEIEALAFAHDRISRRNFRHLLTGANAASLVDADREGLCGYVTVLFHAGTPLGRLYSLAVAPRCRGRGLGAKLLAAAEAACRAQDCRALRLEVHPRNTKARRLYQQTGYHEFGRYAEFYEDGSDAVRMEKPLPPRRAQARTRARHTA
jgi:ribosomal protein S18 acetylase RimI-like enzyme